MLLLALAQLVLGGSALAALLHRVVVLGAEPCA
jgi:hypothetical protein